LRDQGGERFGAFDKSQRLGLVHEVSLPLIE
jgi:hypothetical protein